MRIESEKEDINQPFGVLFDETDTIDDLKNLLFVEFQNTRWRTINDKTSIAIGMYELSEKSNNRATLRYFSGHRAPYIGNFGGNRLRFFNGRSQSFDNLGQIERENPRNRLMIREILEQDSYPAGSGQFSIGNNNVRLNPSTFGDNTYITPPLHFTSVPKAKQLRLKSHIQQLNDNVSLVLFEPDELVANVYRELFVTLGNQSSAEALVVVSNSELTGDMTEMELPNMNGNKTPARLEPAFSHHIDRLQNAPDLVSQSSEYSDINQEKNREFKIITDEEQLRRISETYAKECDEFTSPRQAILLLPKNYKPDEQLKRKLSQKNGFKVNSQLEIDDVVSLAEQTSHDDLGEMKTPTQEHHRLIKSSLPLDPYGLDSHSTRPLIDIPPSPKASRSFTDFEQFPTLFNTTSEKVFPKINVLVVEDNVINQAILGSFLRKHKISYKVAKNGKEAIDRWKDGGLHLIFMDLQLPVMSGIDAAKEIRKLEKESGIGDQKFSSIKRSTDNDDDVSAMLYKKAISKVSHSNKSSSKSPVIIVALTASNSQADKREALISGCNDYLTKPVNLHWLSKKITEWGCMQALIDFDGWKQGESRMTTTSIRNSPSKRSASQNR